MDFEPKNQYLMVKIDFWFATKMHPMVTEKNGDFFVEFFGVFFIIYNMINSAGVKGTATADNAVNFIAFFQQ